MIARDVIARACFDPGDFVAGRRLDESPDQWRARAVLAALTAAGFRILGPDELDPVTVERCSAWHDIQAEVMEGACEAILKRGLYPDHAREANARLHRTSAAAIRSLIPAQPDAKEARAEAWPAGCHSPSSCSRHMACMYTNCRYENRPIKAEIEAALKAKEARDGR